MEESLNEPGEDGARGADRTNGKNGPRRAADAAATFRLQTDAPSCQDCGSIMVRNGTCYHCINCGATSGCG